MYEIEKYFIFKREYANNLDKSAKMRVVRISLRGRTSPHQDKRKRRKRFRRSKAPVQNQFNWIQKLL